MDWVFWRPVRHNLARSLHEVRREWALIDLVEAHAILDLEADIEEFASREAERNSKRT